MARAMIVAVVVPSPATSCVFWATALTSLAPMFSNGSGRSISLLTVTPSLVTVGPPKLLSRMTFRPVGPRVMPTAWASLSAPANNFLRASSVYSNCFAMCNESPLKKSPQRHKEGTKRIGFFFSLCFFRALRAFVVRQLLHDFCQNVTFAQDLDFLAIHLDVGPGVATEQHFISNRYRHLAAPTVIEHLPGAHGQHPPPLGFLLGSIR